MVRDACEGFDVMGLIKPTNPMLRQQTTDFDASEIGVETTALSEKLFEILDATNGIGLAAPQIGIGRSMFVISIDGIRKVFINPTVLSTSESMSDQDEGCLSLPGLTLRISRPTEVTVTWLDENGNQQVADLQGLWARCWLHEYDHLKGILIDDRVSRLELDIARRKLAKKERLNRR